MTILDTIKSLLGLGGRDETDTNRSETTVTVERGTTDEGDEAGAAEPAAAGTDAAASTESLVDEAEAAEKPAARAEPAEAAGPESEDERTDVADVEVDASDADVETDRTDGEVESDEGEPDEVESDEVESDEGEPDETGENGEPVDVLKGIGPAYAERLADAGVETVGQLADADAADLAERITVSEKRVSRWIQRAKER